MLEKIFVSFQIVIYLIIIIFCTWDFFLVSMGAQKTDFLD